SYLEEDPLAADHIDLSGAVIDEPDLSGDITENPVQEPSLENISIDLDLEESEDLEIPEDIEVSEDLEIPEDIEVSEDLGVSEDIEISEDLEISEDIEISEDLGVSEESEDPDVSEGIAGGEISEEIGFEIELDDEEESPLPGGGEAPETGDDEEPPVSISFGDVSESEELKPEEESFAQVIPEGFVVEPDDSQSAFDTVDTGEALQEEDLDILEGDTADELSPEAAAEEKGTKEADTGAGDSGEMSYIPSNIKHELKTVLSYMDQLLESLPEEKIEEFAKSEYFETYKKLFEELGLV
ncbi:MAG: hypothetical protein LBP93_03265, partial [Treponema sp.]|nr:hypothetical protein [Treponema sp.]